MKSSKGDIKKVEASLTFIRYISLAFQLFLQLARTSIICGGGEKEKEKENEMMADCALGSLLLEHLPN